MKRSGIINASRPPGAAGHTDLVVVADAGLPVPAHVPPVDLAPHDDLKAMVARAQLVVRTGGEDTAYANVVLRCGVPFAV